MIRSWLFWLVYVFLSTKMSDKKASSTTGILKSNPRHPNTCREGIWTPQIDLKQRTQEVFGCLGQRQTYALPWSSPNKTAQTSPPINTGNWCAQLDRYRHEILNSWVMNNVSMIRCVLGVVDGWIDLCCGWWWIGKVKSHFSRENWENIGTCHELGQRTPANIWCGELAAAMWSDHVS